MSLRNQTLEHGTSEIKFWFSEHFEPPIPRAAIKVEAPCESSKNADFPTYASEMDEIAVESVHREIRSAVDARYDLISNVVHEGKADGGSSPTFLRM